jgi:hypothetical protein
MELENKIETKIESIFTRLTDDFSKKPIATSIKGIVVIYLVKLALKWLKN